MLFPSDPHDNHSIASPEILLEFLRPLFDVPSLNLRGPDVLSCPFVLVDEATQLTERWSWDATVQALELED